MREAARAIVQRAATDDAFRKRLREEPRGVLAEFDIAVPDDLQVSFQVEDDQLRLQIAHREDDDEEPRSSAKVFGSQNTVAFNGDFISLQQSVQLESRKLAESND